MPRTASFASRRSAPPTPRPWPKRTDGRPARLRGPAFTSTTWLSGCLAADHRAQVRLAVLGSAGLGVELALLVAGVARVPHVAVAVGRARVGTDLQVGAR